MRKIVQVTLLVLVALECLYALLTWSMESIPQGLDEGLRLVIGIPSIMLFAPAGFCIWRWQVRRWCAQSGAQGAIRNLLACALLLLLALEIWFFVEVEPRGWPPHKYIWPPLLAGPLVSGICILILKSESNRSALTSRWLLLLSFAFCVASLLVDALHYSGGWLVDLPVIGSFMISCVLWVFVPLIALGGDARLEGFHWTASLVLGTGLSVIAIWDLRMKRVHWTTAVAAVATGAILVGFISNWSYFIID
jgi:hypothetical protein